MNFISSFADVELLSYKNRKIITNCQLKISCEKLIMSVQLVEKSSSFSPVAMAGTTTCAKTPFGIEDILYISNNNNNSQSVNKNTNFDKNMKNGMKFGGEMEENKKNSGSER